MNDVPDVTDVNAGDPVLGTRHKLRVAIGSAVGTTVENYDFIGTGPPRPCTSALHSSPTQTRSREPCWRSQRWASGSPLDRWAASSVASSATRSAVARC